RWQRIRRHLRSRRILCHRTGRFFKEKDVQRLVRQAERLANLDHIGVHALRHTFCSHLAMKGAPAKAIQELAGHSDLITTQRYMHLSPAEKDHAIRLLNKRPERVETAETGPIPIPIFGKEAAS
ncbi:MAG: tyrosine-type recombinase/integrase, partial [Phycisphaerales bacterium]|nr:tyrosine-type recombinase/integrase [Phycisphaerales bacterium]